MVALRAVVSTGVATLDVVVTAAAGLVIGALNLVCAAAAAGALWLEWRGMAAVLEKRPAERDG